MRKPYFCCFTTMEGLVTAEFSDFCAIEIGTRRWLDEDRIAVFDGLICHITQKTNRDWLHEAIKVAIERGYPVVIVADESIKIDEELLSIQRFYAMRPAATRLVQIVKGIELGRRQREALAT